MRARLPGSKGALKDARIVGAAGLDRLTPKQAKALIEDIRHLNDPADDNPLFGDPVFARQIRDRYDMKPAASPLALDAAYRHYRRKLATAWNPDFTPPASERDPEPPRDPVLRPRRRLDL